MNLFKSSQKSLNDSLAGSLAIQTALLMGRLLPRATGLKIANWIGKRLGTNEASPMVQAIRANQWVIHNKKLSQEKLKQLPVDVFRSATRCLFDYFYFLSRPGKLQSVIDLNPKAQKIITHIQQNEPAVIVAPHLSNFDLIGYALAQKGVDVQVLSFPEPNASYRLQNRIRKKVGLNVTPMTLSAFRQARHRLNSGGCILTGLDRPLQGKRMEKYKVTFFGKECTLPVAYVRMAKEANAPVAILAVTSQPGQSYRLIGSDLIWMESSPDLKTEILSNAHQVHSKAEGMIRAHNRQWAMFYPIWPEFLGV